MFSWITASRPCSFASVVQKGNRGRLDCFKWEMSCRGQKMMEEAKRQTDTSLLPCRNQCPRQGGGKGDGGPRVWGHQENLKGRGIGRDTLDSLFSCLLTCQLCSQHAVGQLLLGLVEPSESAIVSRARRDEVIPRGWIAFSQSSPLDHPILFFKTPPPKKRENKTDLFLVICMCGYDHIYMCGGEGTL